MSSAPASAARRNRPAKRKRGRAHLRGCNCITCQGAAEANGQMQYFSYGGRREDRHERQLTVSVDHEMRRVWAWWCARRDFVEYCNHHHYTIIEQIARYLTWHGLAGVLTPHAAYLWMLFDLVVAEAMAGGTFVEDADALEVDPLTSPLGPALDALADRDAVVASNLSPAFDLKPEDTPALQEQIDRYLARVTESPLPLNGGNQ